MSSRMNFCFPLFAHKQMQLTQEWLRKHLIVADSPLDICQTEPSAMTIPRPVVVAYYPEGAIGQLLVVYFPIAHTTFQVDFQDAEEVRLSLKCGDEYFTCVSSFDMLENMLILEDSPWQ